MFKNKGFLYGLGLGLILGATLLQLMNFAVLDDETIPDIIETVSPSVEPSTVPFATIEPVASIAAIKPIETVKPAETVKPTETTKEPALPSTTPAVTPFIPIVEDPESPPPASTAQIQTDRTIVIQSGMTSSDVSSMLYNEGIIMDEKAFDRSLSQLNLDRIIKIGSFTFIPDESIDDIINKITIRK